jgi:hypothetical protein
MWRELKFVKVDITIEEIHGQVKVRANDINLGAKILNSIQMSAILQCPFIAMDKK